MKKKNIYIYSVHGAVVIVLGNEHDDCVHFPHS